MELKARHVVYVYDDYSEHPCEERSQVYLKSEADKVIAEMKKACNSKDDWCLHTLKENRHHKYKRCLAMAMCCLTEKVYFRYRYDDWVDIEYDRPYKWKKVVFWSKWARRWLELAEQFKEAK